MIVDAVSHRFHIGETSQFLRIGPIYQLACAEIEVRPR